ncbi:MAG: hypothetical protein R2830_19765 [Saprospiraceae bacterium]
MGDGLRLSASFPANHGDFKEINMISNPVSENRQIQITIVANLLATMQNAGGRAVFA